MARLILHILGVLLLGVAFGIYQQPALHLSMFRALLFKAGAATVWTGWQYHALGEELFIANQPRSAHIRLTLYSDIEEWDECADIFQREILPQLDLPQGLEDSDFFGFYVLGMECMSHNGDYAGNLSVLNQMHLQTETQKEFVSWILEQIELTNHMKVEQEPGTRLAVEYLREKKFSPDVENPLVYIRYGRIAMIALVLRFLLHLKRHATPSGAGNQIVILGFGYCIVSREFSILFLVALVYFGRESIFQYGHMQGTIIFALWYASQLHSGHHSESLPSRLIGLEGMVFPQSLERARAQYVNYPYHFDELNHRSGLSILYLWMTRESYKCNIEWLAGEGSCKNANEAARKILEILEVADNETANIHNLMFDTWLTNAMFISSVEQLPIVQRNRQRVQKGVPVPWEEVFGHS